jgi:triosephosphate isomerase (TIM)
MKRIVIANWKMNPQTADEAISLFRGIKKSASSATKVKTIICCPFVYIPNLARHAKGTKMSIGAQDVFWETSGSYTGEISTLMLKNIGVSFVILGHSERRALGETNEDIRKKVHSAAAENMQVILCVGERERDDHGEYLSFIREEVESALSGLQADLLEKIIVAYEPIWAIGKTDDDALSPSGMHEMSLYIRKLIAQLYDRDIADKVSIVYGGSAEPNNVQLLLDGGDIDGFLVGHASLETDDFGKILQVVNNCK